MSLRNPVCPMYALINLELGSAMCISILKLDGTSFDVAVMNSATVKDLKLAIKKKVVELEQSKMGHRHISWTMRSSLMMALHFRVLVFEIILRCIFYPMLSQKVLGDILRGENTASSMA